jgi:hypothetical protein
MWQQTQPLLPHAFSFVYPRSDIRTAQTKAHSGLPFTRRVPVVVEHFEQLVERGHVSESGTTFQKRKPKPVRTVSGTVYKELDGKGRINDAFEARRPGDVSMLMHIALLLVVIAVGHVTPGSADEIPDVYMEHGWMQEAAWAFTEAGREQPAQQALRRLETAMRTTPVQVEPWGHGLAETYIIP